MSTKVVSNHSVSNRTVTNAYADIGSRLMQFRHVTNLSRKGFIEKIEVSVQDFRKMEQGEIPVTADVLNGLISEYRLNLNWLFTGKGKQKIPNTFSGEDLEAIRKFDFKMNQEEFADLLNVDRTTVIRWESHEAIKPTALKILKANKKVSKFLPKINP